MYVLLSRQHKTNDSRELENFEKVDMNYVKD
jgi:hypothetical protein